ncbi:MAG: hypothetical protein AAF598_01360, partial [Bacteroidota bacterium]
VGHYGLSQHLAKNVYRFLLKNGEKSKVMGAVLKFLRRAYHLRPDEMMPAFQTLYDTLVPLKDDPFERRAFIYLDLISWLESKMQPESFGQIIHLKFLEEQRQQDQSNSL